MERSCRSDTILNRLHEVGLRPHGGFLGDGTGAVHRQRGHVPVRKRHAVVLRPGNENRRKRSFPPGQRLQAGRRGAVSWHEGVLQPEVSSESKAQSRPTGRLCF